VSTIGTANGTRLVVLSFWEIYECYTACSRSMSVFCE
jgi:hypothetical protein